MPDTPTIELVAKEEAHGGIAGSDYGSRVRIMARSPKLVLFNALGCNQWDRNPHSGWHGLKSIFKGRPTIAQFEAVSAKVDELFGPGVGEQVVLAWRTHKTVLVDGGGEALPLPRYTRALISKTEYAKISPDWQADLTGEIETCKQCGKPLRPHTDHHRLGHDTLPDHPQTPEQCQKLTNARVIAVHGYGTHASKEKQRLVAWFETWDGEAYLDLDFCSDKCAAIYGRRAVHEREPLEPGGAAPKQEYVPRQDKHHYDTEAAAARARESLERTFGRIAGDFKT